MTVEKINKWCDNCPHVACETCQITWTDIEELKKDIKDNYISKDKIREYIKEKEEEKEGVKNISLEEYAITSKELKESEICLLKCLLEEK